MANIERHHELNDAMDYEGFSIIWIFYYRGMVPVEEDNCPTMLEAFDGYKDEEDNVAEPM